MDFHREGRIEHPASLVLETMIERMQAIVPYLPSIERIDLKVREDLPEGRLHIVREWEASARTVPLLARPFVPRAARTWLDDAIWSPAAFRVDWTLKTSFEGFLVCGGANFCEPHPDDPERATRMRLTGALSVHPERLPGLPRAVASRVGPEIERAVIGLIAPNLAEVVQGLSSYLDRPR